MPAKKKAKGRCFPVWIEKLDNGYWGMCPALSNCFGRGLTYEETLVNLKVSIERRLEEALSEGQEIRPAAAYNFAIMEVES